MRRVWRTNHQSWKELRPAFVLVADEVEDTLGRSSSELWPFSEDQLPSLQVSSAHKGPRTWHGNGWTDVRVFCSRTLHLQQQQPLPLRAAGGHPGAETGQGPPGDGASQASGFVSGFENKHECGGSTTAEFSHILRVTDTSPSSGSPSWNPGVSRVPYIGPPSASLPAPASSG